MPANVLEMLAIFYRTPEVEQGELLFLDVMAPSDPVFQPYFV